MKVLHGKGNYVVKNQEIFLTKSTGQVRNIVFYRTGLGFFHCKKGTGQCHEFVAPPLFFLDSNPSCPG